MATIPQPMPFSDYQSINAINATAIKAGRLSMRHMRSVMTGERKDETPAMRWGKIVHLAVLEPDEMPRQLAVYDGYKKGKDWDAFKSDHESQYIVSPDEQAALVKMSNSVHSKPLAHRLIDTSYHEVTFTWRDDMLGDCKARLDGVVLPEVASVPAVVLDLKTTSMIEARRFGQQFAVLGYGLQFGWYAHAVEVSYNVPVECYVIALESSEPYDCVVYKVARETVRAGYDEAVEIASNYRACCAAKSWPGVDEGADSIPLELPVWATGGAEVDVSNGAMSAEDL